jgi:hypothetical protein
MIMVQVPASIDPATVRQIVGRGSVEGSDAYLPCAPSWRRKLR